MSDLVVGIGLVLVIEGILWAAFPGAARRLLEMANQTSEGSLRISGATAIILGVILVWWVRG